MGKKKKRIARPSSGVVILEGTKTLSGAEVGRTVPGVKYGGLCRTQVAAPQGLVPLAFPSQPPPIVVFASAHMTLETSPPSPAHW